MFANPHEKSKIENGVFNNIRNKLQIQARHLEGRVHFVLAKSESRDDLSVLFGELTSYVATRKQLMPQVASDGYVQKFEGAINKLKSKLKEMGSSL